ncbi:MAG: cysteine-rich VLP protein [Thermoanaerobacter sp.]|nr:cysteine-rich VLP protein [Thermoanaerobacter sp.]
MNKTAKKKKGQKYQGPVELFCPYCDRTMPYGYDPALGYCRCTGCGVSTEDFHTRTKNGLWDPQKKDEVERAVRESGVVYRRGKSDEADTAPPEGAGPAFTWAPPEEKAAFSRVECPCGAVWEALPGVTTCSRCLRVYRVKETGEIVVQGDDMLRCPECGVVFTPAPVKGAAYQCISCGVWTAAEGDREGRETAASENRRLQKDVQARRGPTRLPADVTAKVRELVRRECCNFDGADGCLALDGKCVYFPGYKQDEKPVFLGVPGNPEVGVWDLGDGRKALYTTSRVLAAAGVERGLSLMGTYARDGFIFAVQFAGPAGEIDALAGVDAGKEVIRLPADAAGRPVRKKVGSTRCRWFEGAVLPLDPELEAASWRRTGEVEESRGKEPLSEKEKQTRVKLCVYCGTPFTPKNNFEKYCCEDHRHKATAENKAGRKERRGKSRQHLLSSY